MIALQVVGIDDVDLGDTAREVLAVVGEEEVGAGGDGGGEMRSIGCAETVLSREGDRQTCGRIVEGQQLRFGNRNAILMGLGAARHWMAIPRAIGVTTVAVPEAGRPPVQLDYRGEVHLIPRQLDRLDATLERTELGQALVTTPAQTMYDLLMKPTQGGMRGEGADATWHLRSRVTSVELRRIVQEHGRANAAVRAMLDQMAVESGSSAGG